MTSYPPVASVARALRILQVINSSGPVRISEIAGATGLPKPTVVRLVETLSELGFVQKEPSSKTYFVTKKARTLSVGTEKAEVIAEIALPVIEEFTRQTKLPIAVATPDGASVFVCASTRRESRFSLLYPSRRSHLSLTAHALGRAYLAFCRKDQQLALLKMIAASEAEENIDFSGIRLLLDNIRKAGFAERDPSLEPRVTSTVAVPILVGDRAIGSVGLTYFASSVPRSTVVSEYVPALAGIAATLSRRIVSEGVI